MARMLAALVAIAVVGCGGTDDDNDETPKINIHVANTSAEPVWVGGEYDHIYSIVKFSGMVNPGDVATFTVDYFAGDPLRVRVFRISDSFVLFEAVWRWGGIDDGSPKDPPADVPITIAP